LNECILTKNTTFFIIGVNNVSLIFKGSYENTSKFPIKSIDRNPTFSNAVFPKALLEHLGITDHKGLGKWVDWLEYWMIEIIPLLDSNQKITN
jgi:hypothetical protein